MTVVSKRAQAVSEAAPDKEGAMTDALSRLIQEKIFTTLVEEKSPSGAKLAQAVADHGPTISPKRWAASTRSARRLAPVRMTK